MQEYEGRTLRLTYAKPKKEKVSPPVQSKPAVVYNLFVANLSFAARAKDLKEFFQSAGSDVVSAEIIFNENPRKSSGYGFVSFKTKKEADEALTSFEGKVMFCIVIMCLSLLGSTLSFPLFQFFFYNVLAFSLVSCFSFFFPCLDDHLFVTIIGAHGKTNQSST